MQLLEYERLWFEVFRFVRTRMWPLVALAFCGLLSLLLVSAWAVSRKLAELDSVRAKVHHTYQEVNDVLTDISVNVYRTALLMRALPNVSQTDAGVIAARRSSADAGVQRLAVLLGPEHRARINHLQLELNPYWDAALAAVENAPQGRRASRRHETGQVFQHEAILELAEQLDDLNAANVKREERELEAQAHHLQVFLTRPTSAVLLLGIAIAAASTFRLSRIERRAEEQTSRASRAEFELRHLSNQLVRAQEEERKVISRELHDEVGQLLTGLRMELGSLGPPTNAEHAGFQERLGSVKSLAEEALRSVRNIAMLLRPSMLDDLGLGAALRWQAKEFMRRTGVDAQVCMEGNLDHLPDAYRTCLYRIIQEALTNCSRHADATKVTVNIQADKDLIKVSILDNGKGFAQNGMRTRGLGLISMEERVRELKGRFAVRSEPGHGTIVRVELPLPEGVWTNGAKSEKA
jgi:signal transduction histidine kinase